jgi:uncharacterized protein YecT (DUF1311 family)
MRPAVILLCIALCDAGALCAQQPKCSESQTSVAMRQCLSAEVKNADRALGALLDSLKSEIGDSAVASLNAASQHWSTYRKAECNAVLRSFDGGTMGPVAELGCLLDLANERRARLLALYSGQHKS